MTLKLSAQLTTDRRPLTTFFVGLDLGGTGTRAVLADGDGQVLASGKGGAAGHLSGAAGRRGLARGLDAALAPIAPLIRAESCAIHAGVTGLSLPGRREHLSVELSARFPHATIQISNDALISLWGGLAGQAGIAVLAGTGSIALARAADGREGRAGGWGYLLGDEGGGYWLGRAAIATFLRVLEGRARPSALSDEVARALGRQADSVPRVIAWLHADDRQVSRLANLAPLVSQAADAGDSLAVDILDRAAQALAELVISAGRQVWARAMPAVVPVACCGGVWAAGPHLRAPFDAALATQLPGVTPGRPLLPPVAGAILLAMDAATDPVPPAVVARLKAAFPADPTARGAQ